MSLSAPTTERDREVDAFLHAMAQALLAGDAATLAGLWDVPAFVLGEPGAQAVYRPAEVEHFSAVAHARYLERGVTATEPQVEHREWAGDRIAMVRVRWPYFDDEGVEVGSERSTYALRRDDSGAWRVRVVVAHRD